MPVLLLIELVVVIVPVSDAPTTALPRSAPLLSAPSKLKLVSTLMFLMPRACWRPSSAAGTTVPASAPRILVDPVGAPVSPARHRPGMPTIAAIRAALAQVADIFMSLTPCRPLQKRGLHRQDDGADRSVELVV